MALRHRTCLRPWRKSSGYFVACRQASYPSIHDAGLCVEEVLAAHSLIRSFISCRWFVVCRDIGGTPSSVKRVYDTDIETFRKTTTCYVDEFTPDRWNAPCHSIRVRERIH